MTDEQHDNEPAQLAAWGERATVIEDAKDKRIAELEDQILTYKNALTPFASAKRIRALEAALKPFANVCSYDEDVMNTAGDEPLYVYYGDIDDRDLVEIAYLDDKGDFHHLLVQHLRRAYEVLYGKPAPTASESEADDARNE